MQKIHINIVNFWLKTVAIIDNIRKRNNAREKVEKIFHIFHDLLFPNLLRNHSQTIKQRNKILINTSIFYLINI